jgi:hypothetical protein
MLKCFDIGINFINNKTPQFVTPFKNMIYIILKVKAILRKHEIVT